MSQHKLLRVEKCLQRPTIGNQECLNIGPKVVAKEFESTVRAVQNARIVKSLPYRLNTDPAFVVETDVHTRFDA